LNELPVFRDFCHFLAPSAGTDHLDRVCDALKRRGAKLNAELAALAERIEELRVEREAAVDAGRLDYAAALAPHAETNALWYELCAKQTQSTANANAVHKLEAMYDYINLRARAMNVQVNRVVEAISPEGDADDVEVIEVVAPAVVPPAEPLALAAPIARVQTIAPVPFAMPAAAASVPAAPTTPIATPAESGEEAIATLAGAAPSKSPPVPSSWHEGGELIRGGAFAILPRTDPATGAPLPALINKAKKVSMSYDSQSFNRALRAVMGNKYGERSVTMHVPDARVKIDTTLVRGVDCDGRDAVGAHGCVFHYERGTPRCLVTGEKHDFEPLAKGTHILDALHRLRLYLRYLLNFHARDTHSFAQGLMASALRGRVDTGGDVCTEKEHFEEWVKAAAALGSEFDSDADVAVATREAEEDLEEEDEVVVVRNEAPVQDLSVETLTEAPAAPPARPCMPVEADYFPSLPTSPIKVNPALLALEAAMQFTGSPATRLPRGMELF